MNESIDLDKFSVEQLKQIKDSLIKKTQVATNKLVKKKESVIDEFTSIDELLRDLIQDLQNLTLEQRETNRQLQLTNKLLVMLYFKDDGEGNIVAAQPSGFDASSILKEISSGGASITRVVNLINKDITTDETVFEGEFEGAIAECLFVTSTSSSDNASYKVRITADDNIIYDDTYTNFAARSNYETDMAAFEDEINSVYLCQFQNIHFQFTIKVQVLNSSATFDRIYIKYHRSV